MSRFFLFPGQGSQHPGMGKSLYENSPGARAIFDETAKLNAPSFLSTLFEGSAEDLTDTRTAQPALLAASVATVAALRERGIEPDGCAGHSLGEFAALVTAGCIPFTTAFGLVQTRARLMAERAPKGAMAAVLGLDAEAIQAALPEGVTIANFNGPSQTIIAGTVEGIEAATEPLKAAGAKRVLPIPVSGPFHSPLMLDAADAFAAALEAINMAPPSIPFISSVSGQPEADPGRIRHLLSEQIAKPVRWTEVMAVVGEVDALEVGPGAVLQGLAKRTPGGPTVAPAGTWDAICALS